MFDCASSSTGFAVFVVSAAFFGSSGFDETVGPAAIGPETYAVMLKYGEPAEPMRTGWFLIWTKRASNRMWTTAAMAYVERLCVGRRDIDG